MKYIKTFEQFMDDRGDSINERRVSFHGKTVNDLYRIVKTNPDSEIIVNGKSYNIIDIDEMKNDLKNDTTFGIDEDGGEHEIRVKDIDYIEIIESVIHESEEGGLSRSGHAALGLKQVRIVVSGDSVPENQDKILKSIKKADPSSKCEFYEKTGKIVGTFAKAKMDNIKRDFKGIDPKIKLEIKNQTLK